MELRYDTINVSAKYTKDGYVLDTPILTRSGVFEYKTPDGKIRKEYRPKDVVFNQDSLNKYRGLPITWKHRLYMDSENSKNSVIGAVLSEGKEVDNGNLVADIIVYDTECIKNGDKELSVGYLVRVDEEAGVTDDGLHYDAVQREIVPNHLAVVTKGRAGNARFNLDSVEEDVMEVNKEKIEAYEAKIEQLEASTKEMQSRLDQIEEEHSEEIERLKNMEAIKSSCEKVGVEFKEDSLEDSMKSIVEKVFGEGSVSDDMDIKTSYKMAMRVHTQREDTRQDNAQALSQFKSDSDDELDSQSAEQLRNKYVLGRG